MISDLVKRNAELEEENRKLRGNHEELESALKHSELKREYLAFQIEKLKRMLFGQRSGKLQARPDGSLQLELFEEAKREIELEEADEYETVSVERKKRRAKRKPLPKDLHREQIVHDVDEDLRQCPDCGEEMQCIGHDVSEELEYIPALLYVIEHLLKKYACKKCQSGVIQAELPARPIRKGRPGAGLLAYLLVSKYHDHLPLRRLERIFARHGMEISRKTLCDWVQTVANLLRPIVESMKRELLRTSLLQADETPVKVKDPEVKGKTKKSWIWTYGIPDGEVVYDFTSGRSIAGPMEFLGDFSGYLQSDSYSVYKSLEKRGKTVHIGCWSHVRRRFYDARAEQPEFSGLILAAIQKLFRLERWAREEGFQGEDLIDFRRQESLPTLEKIKELLKAKKPDVLPESGTGDAIDYALNHWTALTRYVEVTEAPVNNNGAERSLRGVAVGRKNWLFIGHPNAGPRAATILSLIETCRRLGGEPFKYLHEVIAELAKNPDRAAELTPRKWLEAQRAEGDKAHASCDR